MKKVILLSIALIAGFSLMAQSQYKVDPAHTSVNFKVNHSGITFVNGKFEKFDGGIIGDMNNIEQARVFFNVDIASINTSVEMRDNHLRIADFFFLVVVENDSCIFCIAIGVETKGVGIAVLLYV